MNLPRGDGLIQIVPALSGNACCHCCSSTDAVQLLRFNSPRRMRATRPREPGQVYVRVCESCLTALATEWLRVGASLQPDTAQDSSAITPKL